MRGLDIEFQALRQRPCPRQEIWPLAEVFLAACWQAVGAAGCGLLWGSGLSWAFLVVSARWPSLKMCECFPEEGNAGRWTVCTDASLAPRRLPDRGPFRLPLRGSFRKAGGGVRFLGCFLYVSGRVWRKWDLPVLLFGDVDLIVVSLAAPHGSGCGRPVRFLGCGKHICTREKKALGFLLLAGQGVS